jgi:hypothetical protein
MKPAGNIHRLPAIDSWQRQGQIKNALLHRIKHITREIHSVQEEMHSKLTESTSGNTMPKFFEDGDAVQVLNDFKAELDQLRRILWFYIEEAGGIPTAAADQDQQANRVERVAELIRALAPQPSTAVPGAAQNKPSVSFFERLDLVMDNYLQEKKPVAQARASKSGH